MRGVTFLHALRYRATKPLSESVAVAAGSINDAVQTLVLRPCRDQFVAAVVDRSIVGENSNSARETPKHAGEAERGGSFEIRSRAHWPLIAHGSPDLLNAWNAG